MLGAWHRPGVRNPNLRPCGALTGHAFPRTRVTETSVGDPDPEDAVRVARDQAAVPAPIALSDACKPGILRVLGPGLITGASDDDPSGIGTYSQAGAQLGFSLCWTMFVTYPLMVAIQEISARV